MVDCWYEFGECKAGCSGKGTHDNPYCFAATCDSIQVGAKIRHRKRSTPNPPPREPNNQWEKGTVKTETGKPLLDNHGEPIYTKEYANNRRKNEARIRELRNHPNPFNDPQLRPPGAGG